MRICSTSSKKSIQWFRLNVCPARHAKWSHVYHQGCTEFAWSITSGIISHVMKALVPLPIFLFSHTPQTFFFQIINYLILFSLHKYSNTRVAWRLEKLAYDRKVTGLNPQTGYESLDGGIERVTLSPSTKTSIKVPLSKILNSQWLRHSCSAVKHTWKFSEGECMYCFWHATTHRSPPKHIYINEQLHYCLWVLLTQLCHWEDDQSMLSEITQV